MIDDDNIPDGIGPHEGRELALMLAGEKPLAMFSDVIPASFNLPEQDFAPHVESGRLIKHEVVFRSAGTTRHDMRFLYYALPGETWRIDRMAEINRSIHEQGQKTTCELESEIGQLLGYSDADILAFADRIFAWKNDKFIPDQ